MEVIVVKSPQVAPTMTSRLLPDAVWVHESELALAALVLAAVALCVLGGRKLIHRKKNTEAV